MHQPLLMVGPSSSSHHATPPPRAPRVGRNGLIRNWPLARLLSFPSSVSSVSSVSPLHDNRTCNRPSRPLHRTILCQLDLDLGSSTLLCRYPHPQPQYGTGIQTQGRQLACAATRREAGGGSRGPRRQGPSPQRRGHCPGDCASLHTLRGAACQGRLGDEREAHLPVARRCVHTCSGMAPRHVVAP